MAKNSPLEEKVDCFDYSSDSRRRRKRSVFTKEQVQILKKYFKNNSYPGFEERKKLSKLTNIPEDRIHVWFHNRRARESLQQKSRASECSTNLGQMCLNEVSSGPVLEEDFLKQKLPTLSASRPSSQANEPSQESGPRNSCSCEKSPASTTEPICSHGIPQMNLFSFQTMGPSNEIQLHALPGSMFQRRSNQWASSWAHKGSQGSENSNTPISFCGERKPPLHLQKQGWAMALLNSNRSTPAYPGCRGSASTSAAAVTPPTELPQQPHPHQLSALKQMPQHSCTKRPCLSEKTSNLISTPVTDPEIIIIKEEEQDYESFCS